MMNTLTKVVLAALVIIVIGIIGRLDAEDSAAQYEYYCSMVAIWNTQAKAGIPIDDRTGWPPYNGECK